MTQDGVQCRSRVKTVLLDKMRDYGLLKKEFAVWSLKLCRVVEPELKYSDSVLVSLRTHVPI